MQRLITITAITLALTVAPLGAGTRSRVAARDWSFVNFIQLTVPQIIYQIIYGPNTRICSDENPRRPGWCPDAQL